MSTLDRTKSKAEVRPANLFFVELIIVLLFFSLSAAIILRVFAAADNKQKLGELTEKSIIRAQSLAECYSVTGDASAAAEQVFGVQPDMSEGMMSMSLDSELSPAQEEAVLLTMTELSREQSGAGALSSMRITFTAGESELFSLTCTAYIPNEGGAAVE